MAFAEWGLTRDDIGKDIDSEVFALIESTGFKAKTGGNAMRKKHIPYTHGRNLIRT